MLGYPEQALTRSQETLALASQLGHIHSLAAVCNFAALLHQFRWENQAVYEQTQTASALAMEHAMDHHQIRATILAGWCLGHQGQGEVGITQMHQGLSDYETIGTRLYREWYLTLLAEVYGHNGQPDAGLDILAEVMALVRGAGGTIWDAELNRLQGELLLQQSPDNASESESCFRQAISISKNQRAKSWELRASTSLAKLWQQQDKRQEAYDLLAPVYGWFTEGFDTADLIDAKRLLDELT